MNQMGIVVNKGVIESIKSSMELVQEYSIISGTTAPHEDIKFHDVEGQAVVPGLIDAHTHLLWAGDRSKEVAWRREGLSYSEIASMGGGIQHTVRATREASDDHLFALGYQRMREALRTGTTHMEAKSGYGLDTPSELRLLDIAAKLNDVAHTPHLTLHGWGRMMSRKDWKVNEYVEHLLSEQLPAVREQGLARSADVFCELAGFPWNKAKISCALHAKRGWHCACMLMNSPTAVVGLWRANLAWKQPITLTIRRSKCVRR